MPEFFVRPTTLRPDCRLVITFLWGDLTNCETDGNACNPASRDWTELYCQNRERPEEVFDITPRQHEPLLLSVQSPLNWLAARAAYFLAEDSQGDVSEQPSGPYTGPDCLARHMGEFDLEAARERVRQRHFQGATLENPYPNLKKQKC